MFRVAQAAADKAGATRAIAHAYALARTGRLAEALLAAGEVAAPRAQS
jgi:hypothetical protein